MGRGPQIREKAEELMSYLTFFLVLVAACLHASWNFLAKRAGNSSGFIWLFNLLSTLFYTPILCFVLITERPGLSWLQVIFLLGSACLHLAYFLFLQRGYALGDLSLAYPLARGTGPLLSTACAIVLLGERPSLGALCGAFLLIAGVLLLVGNPWRIFAASSDTRGVIILAFITGIFIAAYTIWDKEAVSTFLISPLLLSEASSILMTAMLSPATLKNWSKVRETWQLHRWKALGVGLMSPLAYLLILSALISSPVSQVAPLRESSVLVGTFMGARFLSEKHGWSRLGAAALILTGIILLSGII